MSQELEQWIEELMKLEHQEDRMTEKQLKIVKAATEVFAEKGFSAASTSEIAQRAGVAEGTIFRHYKTKKELLISIVAPIMTRLVGPLVLRDFYKVLDSNEKRFEDFLRLFIVNRLNFARSHLNIIKIFIQEIPFQPELRELYMKHVASKIVEKIRLIVEKYQADGQIIPIPPLSVVKLCVSACLGFVISRVLFNSTDNEEEELEHTIQFVLYGLTPRIPS